MRTQALTLMAVGAAVSAAHCGPFAPAAGVTGSTAIGREDPRLVGWASGVAGLQRGYQSLADPELGRVTWGQPSDALGMADAHTDSLPAISLGDDGWITLTFEQPITNGSGTDFAVFENGINDTFLELAFVEVSSNGRDFIRFPAISLTQTNSQISGELGMLDTTNIHNLAGKYRRGFGTPFNLDDVAGRDPKVDVTRITHVRIVDVVGSIQGDYARYDSQTPARIINERWETPYETGGFDLDAIGVIHQIPEPCTSACTMLGFGLLGLRRSRLVPR